MKFHTLLIFFVFLNFNTQGASNNYILTDSTKTIKSDSIRKVAKIDAKKYFKNKKENTIVIVGTFICTPLLGWIIPLYFQKKGINNGKIPIPQSIYSKNESYIDAYREEFYKIRKRKLWLNYIFSSLAFFILSLILYSILVIFFLFAFLNIFSDWFENWFY